MSDHKMRGVINPLAFLPLDEPGASWPLDCEAILKYLCADNVAWEPERIAERYREMGDEQRRLFVTPAEPRILERLVWPLRNAKGCYMLGNYLGTIALAGMVAEMVAMLIYEIGLVRLNEREMDEKVQAGLYGAPFEKLGQDRRVKILSTHGLIGAESVANFDTVREKRRRYLHLWSDAHDDLAADARACYHAALGLVVQLLNPRFTAGAIAIDERLMQYLGRKGVSLPTQSESS